MKLVCAPPGHAFSKANDVLNVVLYGSPIEPEHGSAGAAIRAQIAQSKLSAAPKAWDLLSIALSVVTADLAGHRDKSPDGWTREFDLEIAVVDPQFWQRQQAVVESLLAFLTTDIWRVRFTGGGFLPPPEKNPTVPAEDCIVLLSGGLDSLIGAIDLSSKGRSPFAISHLVRGDADKQVNFAHRIGGGLRHLQLNHNASAPGGEDPPTQRARSLAFLAYGVVAATTLLRYRDGETVPLYICENGFVAINPPLTGARLGSLSTRTTHPALLNGLQRLLDDAELRVRVSNPYALKTKGEMMVECVNQTLLAEFAPVSTSCGRFKRFGYKHCGRCMPCQVRRAAFLRWGKPDLTTYVFDDLGQDDEEHSAFDDVRSASMAVTEVRADGIGRWVGNSLIGVPPMDQSAILNMLERGLAELEMLHKKYAVK